MMAGLFLCLRLARWVSSFPAGPFLCDSGEQDEISMKGLREIHPAGGGWIQNAAVV